MQTMLHNMQLVSQFVLQFKNSEKSCEFCHLARNFCARANNIAREVARSDCRTLQYFKNALQRCRNHCEKQKQIVLRATLVATKMLRGLMIVIIISFVLLN